MRIAVDLRGLNYKHITGINTYTLHLLLSLLEIKNNKPDVNFVAIGLDAVNSDRLINNYKFLDDLFDDFITTNEYLGVPFGFDSKMISTYLILSNRFGKIFSKRCMVFDYLLLPQPKSIIINPSTKMIVAFHDLYGVIETSTKSYKQRIVESLSLYKLLARNSWKILTNSISTSIDVRDTLGEVESKILLTYPAMPRLESDVARETIIDLPDKYIVSVSGIEKRKNWINLLLAHDFLNSEYSDYDIELVLIGRVVDERYYKKIRRIIKQKNIKNVKVLIDLSDSEKKKVIENSMFTVYSSFWEGFGFPILESFYYGKVVVTSRISSMPELAKDSGVYVNPFNYKEIAIGIYILFKDEKFRKKLESATKKNLEFFSWNELTKRLESLLR